MLNLFEDVLKQGRNYPTPQEIRNTFGSDMEFSRSHVRPHAVMYNQAKRDKPDNQPKTKNLDEYTWWYRKGQWWLSIITVQ